MANSTVAEIEVARSAVAGKLFWAVAGTAIPTNATTALDAAFKNLGYINEDGVQTSREVGVDPVKNDNGLKLLDIQNDFSKGYTATLYQVLNEDVNNMIYGDANTLVTAPGVSTGTLLAVQDSGLISTPGRLVIEWNNGGLGKGRRVVPIAQVTAVEEGALAGTAVRTIQITWSASPDSSGFYDYTYHTDGIVAP